MGIRIGIGRTIIGQGNLSSGYWTPSNYVDIFNGNDSNDGSLANPWLTLTHADSVLTLNAPLKLKYPDGTWHNAPAYWHGLRAFFPMVAGADTTKVYDVANGLVGTVVGAVKYSGTLYPGISLEANGYVDLGVDALSIGTGDQTLLATVFPVSPAAGPFTIFSNGAVAAQKGCALYTGGVQFGYQMRNAATVVGAAYNSTIPAAHVVVSTIKRNNTNGFKFFIDGVIKNTPGVSTTSLGVEDLSPVKHTMIGGRHATDYSFFCACLWIKELRVYNAELSELDVVAISTEATVAMNKNYAFSSGTYFGMGIDPSWYTSTHQHLGVSGNKEGPFFPLPQMTYTGAPSIYFGNAKILPLNVNKCNGSVPSSPGEINWLMTHEVPEFATGGLYLATSHNGIDWQYVREMPGFGSMTLGQCDWFIDNDDPSDFNNIHQIIFAPTSGRFYETHPLNSSFTSWSDLVLIFDTGIIKVMDAHVIKIGTVYHMFYSTSIALPSQTNYMYHAICTYGPFSAVNDWHNVGIGNWSGLGNIESMSFVYLGGTNWIMYYEEIGAPDNYKYSLTVDDGATWGVGVRISSLSAPFQMSVGIIKMK